MLGAEKKETERLAAWNAEWEAHNKTVLYGTELITVINKADQNNKEYNYSEKYRVKINVYLNNTLETKTFVEERKTSIFECTSVHYNEETGRIDEMSFKFKE